MFEPSFLPGERSVHSRLLRTTFNLNNENHLRYVLPLELLLAVPLPLAGQAGVERFGVVMGTELRVEVAGADRSEALAAAEAALREIE